MKPMPIVIFAAILVGGIIGMLQVCKPMPPMPPEPEHSYHIIKDKVTNCQYIISGGAMYPRLDDRRVHICSDDKKYYFTPEGN